MAVFVVILRNRVDNARLSQDETLTEWQLLNVNMKLHQILNFEKFDNYNVHVH